MEHSKKLLVPITEEQDSAIKGFCGGMSKSQFIRTIIDLVDNIDRENAVIVIMDKNNIKQANLANGEILDYSDKFSDCKLEIEYSGTNVNAKIQGNQTNILIDGGMKNV